MYKQLKAFPNISRLDKKNFLLPWLGLTFITPAVFLSSLVTNLLFLNLPGVLWLLARDGLPVAFILFLIYTVYTLFLEMGDRQSRYSSEIEMRFRFPDLEAKL